MALLHNPTDQAQQELVAPGYSELHLRNFRAQNGLAHLHANKWMYLIANNIRFSAKMTRGIKLVMPSQDKLYGWMEKVITAGQCSILFVENLQLDDFRVQKITQMCEQYAVTLVNLTLDEQVPENVIVGPWH